MLCLQGWPYTKIIIHHVLCEMRQVFSVKCKEIKNIWNFAGFGFVSFESDDPVERLVAEHFVNVNGKQVCYFSIYSGCLCYLKFEHLCTNCVFLLYIYLITFSRLKLSVLNLEMDVVGLWVDSLDGAPWLVFNYPFALFNLTYCFNFWKCFFCRWEIPWVTCLQVE